MIAGLLRLKNMRFL